MQPIIDALARDMAAAGVGAYSPDAALPVGQVPITIAGFPPTPDTAICVSSYAGAPEPDSRNGWESPRLQVRVRALDPLVALEMERTVWGVLQFAVAGPEPRSLPPATVGAARWWLQDCYALQSEPEPLGRDDAGRWEYARNYQLETLPPI